jgi:hypothetical protein
MRAFCCLEIGFSGFLQINRRTTYYCRSELAREGLKDDAFFQKKRVIVNVLREQARSYGAKMTQASSSDCANALKHLNLSAVSCSHAGSHWSWPPDKLAALLDCPLGA